MRELFQDREHLVRLGGLLIAGIVLFFTVAAILVPEGFGTYGHYRAGALDDNRSYPLVYAGHAACADCHDDVVTSRTGGKHAGVNCEICHGALAKHADDPAAVTPELPNGGELCLGCHQQLAARPAGFPQIDPREHNPGDPCTTCHPPHHPDL